MTVSGSAEERAAAQFAPGPLVWLSGITLTAALLAALKQALWIVVPFLLAIILYYAQFPAVQRLTLAGVRREVAAVIVMGTFFILAVVAALPSLPWIAAHMAEGEDALVRYLEAGRAFVDRTLLALEREFGFLQQVGLQAETNKMIEAFGANYMRTHLTSALLGAVSWLPTLLLAPFVAFFLLRDGRRFLDFLYKAVVTNASTRFGNRPGQPRVIASSYLALRQEQRRRR